MASENSPQIKRSMDIEQSKRDKRLESKKRKAIALLNLIQEREKEKESADSDSIPDNESSTPVKQRKVAKEVDSADSNETSTNTTNWLSEDEAQKLRIALREKQKASMQKPKLYLTLEELLKQNTSEGEGDAANDEVPPLFMQDVQHLLLLGVMGNSASMKPRWCRLLRMSKVASVVVMVINELCVSDLEEYAECLPFIRENFSMFTDVVSPSQYQSTADKDIFRVPLSRTRLSVLLGRNKIRRQKQEEKAQKKVEDEKNIMDKRNLLLSPSQLIAEGYPLPIKTHQDKCRDFVFSKYKYTAPKADSPIFSIDCEMCLTTARVNELTRVSMVNEDLEMVYDSFVKPYNRIVNYLTQYSGVTKEILDPVTVRLEDVQRDLQRILPSDAICCGQSLCFDLKALHMFHPYVIDTSVIYNQTGLRWKKTGLRKLSELFLDYTMQGTGLGHCSLEDSRMTMKLVLLKLKNGYTFGDCILEEFHKNQEQIGDTACMSSETNQKPGYKTLAAKSDLSKGTTAATTGKQEPALDKVGLGNQTTGSSISTNGDFEPRDSLCKKLEDKTAMEEKRNVFLQEKYYSSLFEEVKKEKKTAAVIDNKEVTSRWESETKTCDNVTFVPVSSDSACYKETKKQLTDSAFVWTQFHDFSLIDPLTPEAADLRKESLQKVNKYLKKLTKKVMENSLVCVLLTGRNEEHKLCNGGVFVKIT